MSENEQSNVVQFPGTNEEITTDSEVNAENPTEAEDRSEVKAGAGFFDVVELDGSVTKSDGSVRSVDEDSDRLKEAVKAMLDLGYESNLVERARVEAKGDITSTDAFEQLIAKIMKDEKDAAARERARVERIKDSIHDELERLKASKHPHKHLKDLIRKEYNTSAVELCDLFNYVKDNPELRLDIYEQPVYSLTMQIKKQFVADAIQRGLDAWKNCEMCDAYVENYLNAIGVPPELYEKNKRTLVESLSSQYRDDVAPDNWKAFKAVRFLTHQEQSGADEDADIKDRIFNNEEDAINYTARLENYVEEDIPIDMANSQACEDYYNDLDDEDKMSVAGRVGQFAGRVVRLKYDLAEDMEDMMRASLGEHADEYFAQREAVKARKAEIKAAKWEAKQEAKEQRREEREEEREQRREEKREERAADREERKARAANPNYNNTRYGNGYGNSRYYDNRYGVNNYGYGYRRGGLFGRGRNQGYGGYGDYGGYGRGANFAPRIPMMLVIVFIHIIVALLFWIFLSKSSAIIAIVGLVISTFGFVRQKTGEKGSIAMIGGGYVLAAIAIFLK